MNLEKLLKIPELNTQNYKYFHKTLKSISIFIITIFLSISVINKNAFSIGQSESHFLAAEEDEKEANKFDNYWPQRCSASMKPCIKIWANYYRELAKIERIKGNNLSAKVSEPAAPTCELVPALCNGNQSQTPQKNELSPEQIEKIKGLINTGAEIAKDIAQDQNRISDYNAKRQNEMDRLQISFNIMKEGEGIKDENLPKALELFKKSAELGNNEALRKYRVYSDISDDLDKNALEKELYEKSGANKEGSATPETSFELSPEESQKISDELASVDLSDSPGETNSSGCVKISTRSVTGIGACNNQVNAKIINNCNIKVDVTLKFQSNASPSGWDIGLFTLNPGQTLAGEMAGLWYCGSNGKYDYTVQKSTW